MLDYLDYKSVTLIVCWALICLRGLQNRAVRLYAPFYLMVAVVFASFLASVGAAGTWGLDSATYLRVYFATEAAIQISTGIFLLWIMTLPEGYAVRRIGVFLVCAAVSAAALEYLLVGTGAWNFLRLARVGVFFLFLVAALAILRCAVSSRFRLGRNLAIAVGARFVLLFVEVLNSSLYLTGDWSRENWDNATDFISLACWGATVWGMWDLDVPKRKD